MSSTDVTAVTHLSAATQFIDAGDVRLAFRRFGTAGATPLVMLQHFRARWAAERDVILVDYPGVGASTGDFGPTAERTPEGGTAEPKV